MKLVAHGGNCCGMRHIHGMNRPDYLLGALTKLVHPNLDEMPYEKRKFAVDSYNYEVANRGRFTQACPKESAEDRLRRLLLFCEDADKTIGIIEVVVAQPNGAPISADSFGQAARWKPVLERLGFVHVNESANSTSSNIIHVWHYKTGVGNREKLGTVSGYLEADETGQDQPMGLEGEPVIQHIPNSQ